MRILLADDDALSRTLVQRTLRSWSFDTNIVCDGAEAWDVLQTPNRPQIAILDWHMPHHDGTDLCRMVREANLEPYVYIILLTARAGQADVVTGLKAGADDYLTKPVNIAELRARLSTAERIVTLQKQLLAARDAHQFTAMRDDLTHLLNRRAILQALDSEIARCSRDGSSVGVFMIDLDHFKSVNDNFGHRTGDAVLIEACSRMSASLRPFDLAGRYGGEEFLAIIPGLKPCDAEMVGEKIRASIDGACVFSQGKRIAMSASVGGAVVFVPAKSGSESERLILAESLIREADAALYRAKDAGRNCVVVADPGASRAA